MTTETDLPRLPVLQSIAMERVRQDNLWGEQNHPDLATKWPDADRASYRSEAEYWKRENAYRVSTDDVAWDGILLEEVFEALSEKDPQLLREELIQVAAVATAWAEAIDRRLASDD